MPIDVGELYAVLRAVAASKRVISYKELSALYFERTGEDHHWHGTWDEPLCQVNGHAQANGLPAISAVVTYQINEDDPDSQYGPPGELFWGSPGVPPRPATASAREELWWEILARVHCARWPEHLTGLG